MAGAQEYADVRRELYAGAGAVVIVYDSTCRATFQRLSWWVDELEHYGSGEPAPVVLVAGNKADSGAREVGEADGRRFATKLGCPHFETSALTGQGVRELFATLLARALARRSDTPEALLALAEAELERL